MNLSQRILKLNPHQRRLLELKMKQQGADIYQIPITQGYRENYPGHFPLSLEQEPMWVIEKLDPDNPSYNAPGTISMQGDLRPDLLEKSIDEVVKRHEILRTAFITDKDKPAQVIRPSLSPPLERIDLKDLPPQEQENKLEQVKEDKGLYTFDLAGGPLVKTLLVELSGNEYILITIMHHIVSDLLSLKIFLKEVSWNYRLFLSGTPPAPPLPVMPFQYVDYACWQQYWFRESILGIEALKKQEAFWQEMFREEAPVLNLPADYPRPPLKSYQGDHAFFTLKGEEPRKLKEIFLKENSTLSGLLLSIYYIFLAKISGQEDIVVGTPVNSRQSNALKNMIGLFVKTMPLRNYPYGNKTFKGFLQEVNTGVLNAFENQDYSYEQLVRKTLKERDVSRNPLFDVLFNFIYIDMSEIAIPGIDVKPYRFNPKRVGFDLELICEGTYEELFFKLSYSSKLFKEETIRRFISYIRQIMEKVIKDPGVRISAIEIITPQEKEQILFTFNNTTADYQRDKTIIPLVEERVLKNPDSIAAAFANHFLTYGVLQETYLCLAGLLKSKGMEAEVIVGLMTERSLEMLVGMLGILKAGGAYLPIDPGIPQERINYMLTDSQAGILLVTPGGRQRMQFEVPEASVPLPGLTLKLLELKAAPSTSTSARQPGPTNLAYVIYTSGSTGKPKGVTITHRNVINFMQGMNARIGFSGGKAILALTTLSFDILVLETLLPLVQGLKVVIATREQQKDPRLLARKTAAECLNMVQLTPSALKLMIDANIDLICLKNVEILMVGGERFPGELLEKLRLDYHGHIYNMYGPTETTVWSTVKDLTTPGKITIGYPIANTQVYILDKHGRMQPMGVLGELCIGGEGTARGYLNRPELTREKFLTAFYRSNTSNKSYFYRTGDLARWQVDGDIEFLGRMDYQVKIRGFRIELEEIEAHLKRHEGIAEVVVIVKTRDNGDHFLCAYYIPRNPGQDQGVFVLELRGFLAAELPDYMVPAFFVPLEQIPLTPNKKIDRKALAEYPINQPHAGSYLAPRTELEKKVAQCWMKVLKIDEVSLHDNFFELGGNSSNIIQLNNELKNALGEDIHVALLYRHLTVSSFVRFIRESKGQSGRGRQQAQPTQPVESPGRQQALFKNAIKKTRGTRNGR